jgi:hypothetical protein
MADVPFFPATYSRSVESLPTARLVNMILEKTPQGPFPTTLRPRPALTVSHTPAAAPIRAMFKMNNVLSGDTLSVCGNHVYDESSSLGMLSTSTGRCEIDASASDVVIVDCVAGLAYSTGGGFAEITDADLPDVVSVAFYAGRWFFAEKDSSRFWWSALDDPTTIDGLAFASTEASPDKIVRIMVLGDDLVFLCSNTVEFWYATGDADQPVQRYSNRTFARGIVAAESAVKADNTIMWIGDDGVPYRADNVPRPLIDPASGSGYGIIELIRDQIATGSFTFYAWQMTYDGHAYYAINISGVAYLYDLTTGSWSQWDITTTHSAGGNDAHLGGPSGTIYVPDASAASDDAGVFTRLGSAFVPISDGVSRCDELALVTRASAEASISMRYYDDEEVGWSAWSSTSTAKRVANWRRLGSMKAPGRYFEFSCDDNVMVNFCGLKLNPARV